MTELILSERCGFSGEEIMFSSNVTPPEEYLKALELGAIINLDDYTHVEFLNKLAGIPKKICCRFNPGGYFAIANQIMDNPNDAKYGMTKGQMILAYKRLMELGAEEFGIHAFLASNTLTNDYYPLLAAQLFELAVDLRRETGANITFINLSGGIGIPYLPTSRKRYYDHRRERAQRVRGDPRPGRNGRHRHLHRARPLHAGAVRLPRNAGDP
jgi:diaminopimelate decarboxylase